MKISTGFVCSLKLRMRKSRCAFFFTTKKAQLRLDGIDKCYIYIITPY